MLFCLMSTTIVLGAIIGFVDFSEAAFFRGLAAQIVQGMLSIACLILVGAAFWRFGWKIGLVDLLLVIGCLECRSSVAQSSTAWTVALCQSCFWGSCRNVFIRFFGHLWGVIVSFLGSMTVIEINRIVGAVKSSNLQG